MVDSYQSRFSLKQDDKPVMFIKGKINDQRDVLQKGGNYCSLKRADVNAELMYNEKKEHTKFPNDFFKIP
jgi:hypothetical protein